MQYDEEHHTLYKEISAKDYTRQMIQFFDHYLKDSAAPRWMLYGIPAKDKGYDDGFDLVHIRENNGRWLTPGPGLSSDSLESRNPNIPKRFEDWNKPLHYGSKTMSTEASTRDISQPAKQTKKTQKN